MAQECLHRNLTAGTGRVGGTQLGFLTYPEKARRAFNEGKKEQTLIYFRSGIFFAAGGCGRDCRNA
jgi:hypothetical protein